MQKKERITFVLFTSLTIKITVDIYYTFLLPKIIIYLIKPMNFSKITKIFELYSKIFKF